MKTHPLSPPLDGLTSTLAGWLGGLILIFVADTIQGPSRVWDWLVMDVVCAILCVPMLFVLWMLLWGLLTVAPTVSRLWHPLLCVPMGAVVGSGLFYLYSRVVNILFSSAPDPTPFSPVFNFGVPVGASALGALCIIRRLRR